MGEVMRSFFIIQTVRISIKDCLLKSKQKYRLMLAVLENTAVLH